MLGLTTPIVPVPEDDDLVSLQDGNQSPEEALEQRKNEIVTKAQQLAAAVKDKASCEAAAQFATFVDEALREAKAYFDPKVVEARKPYETRLAERKAVCEPLENAKEILTGKAGAVTRWMREETDRAAREQQRLQREADERAEQERRAAQQRAREQEANARRQREEAEAAQKAGDAARARELASQAAASAQAAVDATEEASQVEAPIVTVTVQKPVVAGVQHRENWTYEVRDIKQLVLAIAAPHHTQQAIEAIRSMPGFETATGPQIVALLEGRFLDQAEIPVNAVEANTKYLGQRAKADRNTLQWPGVRFYDSGSTAIRSAKGGPR